MIDSILLGWFGQIIIGTKGDDEAKRQVTDDEAAEYARSVDSEYMLTSAKTGDNIDEAFTALVRKLRKAKEVASPRKSQVLKRRPNQQRKRSVQSNRTQAAGIHLG
jgi:GTPase SAR1 family protein